MGRSNLGGDDVGCVNLVFDAKVPVKDLFVPSSKRMAARR